MESKIDVINAKIQELEAERADIERGLLGDNKRLNVLLTDQALGDNVSTPEISTLRQSILKHELRAREIANIIPGLGERRKKEEERLRLENIAKQEKELKKLDLTLYKMLLERLKHARATYEIDKTRTELNSKRGNLVSAINALDNGTRLATFTASSNPLGWFTDQKYARSGMEPWNDFESDAGQKYIEEEIARLENEVSK